MYKKEPAGRRRRKGGFFESMPNIIMVEEAFTLRNTDTTTKILPMSISVCLCVCVRESSAWCVCVCTQGRLSKHIN